MHSGRGRGAWQLVFTPMNNMKKLKQHVSEDRVAQGFINQNVVIFFLTIKKKTSLWHFNNNASRRSKYLNAILKANQNKINS